MIQIGNQTIRSRVLLAPLSACSDLAFRLMARSYGAQFCFFEMIDAQSLKYDSERSVRMLRTTIEDQPIAAQLLGSDPEVMRMAAEKIMDRASIQFLDINAACPAKKVFKKGSGSCFMQDPVPLFRIIEYLTQKLAVPITVKMRVGLSQVNIEQAVQFAQGCESSGAAALFVHGRTRSQENYGEVSYSAIRAVKQAVKIPVIGSGNVLNPLLAKKMFNETGCDGVLVAKGSFGNPFIYSEIEEYLKTGYWVPRVDLREKLIALKKHISLAEEIEGERFDRRIGEFGKICLWYIKGFAEASQIRAKVFSCQNVQQLYSLIDQLLENA